MTDRQMLEDAARAAGMVIEWKEGHCKGGPYAGAFVNGVAWRPREDDGDSLRLAVAAGIEVGNYHQYGRAVATIEHTLEFWEFGEPMDATRRAILRAAASIGAKMREEGHG